MGTADRILGSIAFVVGNYPSRAHPNRGTFVRQLVEAVARRGVDCTVIHPWKLHEWVRERAREPRTPLAEMRVRLCRPLTLSLSNRRWGPWNTYGLTLRNFRRAVWRVLRQLPEKPVALYGHFLYPSGSTAVWAGKRMGRPAFVAVGESFDEGSPGLWSLESVGVDAARRQLAGAAGFVAVSSLLRAQLKRELGLPEESIRVFPNGVDPRCFWPRDRRAMRQKHGLPEDRFLLAYVGVFDERKGVQRVCRAMQGLPGVSGIFVGQGPQPPAGDQVAFCGRVPHEQVPELLSAADCFVLPSLAEGSSNATLEAMACGLPVMVSDRAFNRDICDADSAWMIDPQDVAAIREGIVRWRDDPAARNRFARAALARAAAFDVQRRAQRILEWMAQRIASQAG